MADHYHARQSVAILIAVHLCVGLAMAFDSVLGIFPNLVGLPYFIFVASESLLLSVWGGISNVSLLVRLPAIALGIVWITLLLAAPYFAKLPFILNSGGRGVGILVGLVACICGVIIGVALFGHFAARIEWAQAGNSTRTRRSTQFTVKSLLIATAIFAALLAIGGALRRSVGYAPPTFEIVPTFIVSQLLVAWLIGGACLGLGNPLFRVPIAILASAIVGLLAAFSLGAEGWEFETYSLAGMSTAIVSSISLLLVRRWGYRLVLISHPANQKEIPHENLNKRVTD